MMFDGAAFGAEMVQIVKGYVDQATAPLLARIDELERRELVTAEPGRDGDDCDMGAVFRRLSQEVETAIGALPTPAAGRDCDMVAVAELIGKGVAQAVGALPAPAPGKDADIDAVRTIVAELTQEAVAEHLARAIDALPAPAAGRDCDMDAVAELIGKGIAQAVGALPAPAPGRDADIDAVRAIVAELTQQAVAEHLAKAIDALPTPAAGRDCDMDAVAELIGKGIAQAVAAIPAPAAGKDGVGLASALINRGGELVLTMTDGGTIALGEVVGKDGDPGKDAETFTLDDFDIEQIDERSFRFKFTHGGECHSFDFAFPVPLYRDTYAAGKTYQSGDMVTWGGSLWHCDKPTAETPGGGGWTLAVKKGRPGKDAAKC